MVILLNKQKIVYVLIKFSLRKNAHLYRQPSKLFEQENWCSKKQSISFIHENQIFITKHQSTRIIKKTKKSSSTKNLTFSNIKKKFKINTNQSTQNKTNPQKKNSKPNQKKNTLKNRHELKPYTISRGEGGRGRRGQ